MTEQEAICEIIDHKPIIGFQRYVEALNMAIKALEKQTPKKLMRHELREDKVMCPHCANWIDVSSKVFCCYFCCYCGQKLDWGDV